MAALLGAHTGPVIPRIGPPPADQDVDDAEAERSTHRERQRVRRADHSATGCVGRSGAAVMGWERVAAGLVELRVPPAPLRLYYLCVGGSDCGVMGGGVLVPVGARTRYAMIELPRYYEYGATTLKVVETSAGDIRGYMLNSHAGRFEIANSELRKVRFDRDGDIYLVNEVEFIKLTEENRSGYLWGYGPIFEIYKQIDNWFSQRDTLDREEWLSKREQIPELRRETFKMWEEEFARQDAGQPPSFTYGSVAGPAAVEKFSRVDRTPDLSASEVILYLG